MYAYVSVAPNDFIPHNKVTNQLIIFWGQDGETLGKGQSITKTSRSFNSEVQRKKNNFLNIRRYSTHYLTLFYSDNL